MKIDKCMHQGTSGNVELFYGSYTLLDYWYCTDSEPRQEIKEQAQELGADVLAYAGDSYWYALKRKS